MNFPFRKLIYVASIGIASSAVFSPGPVVQAEPVIPGTGVLLTKVGDQFEDPNWKFIYNHPKSSKEQDERVRSPTGYAKNRRWYEGAKRGYPDIVQRVPTPAGGLPGSQGSLLLRSLKTGIPGYPSRRLQQDDFVADVKRRIGTIAPAERPSVVTRVFMPPVDEWENYSKAQFGFRLAVMARMRVREPNGRFVTKLDTYWPGMFIVFQSKDGNSRREDDYAFIRIRGNRGGGDFKGKQITQTGWWTMGMSVSPDGMIHYYAKPGVEDLNSEDHIASQFPYGHKALKFKTFFFNVANYDNGKNWSTAWIVDDCLVYKVPLE